jgi:methionine--tRNA ligase beta chain
MDTISFDDFKKLDIRIGTVKKVSVPEGSNKMLRLVVDIGELGVKVIFAGIKETHIEKDLIGKQIVVLVNLAPKEFFGEKGEGMLLAVDTDTTSLLTVEKTVPNGGKVT